MGTKIVHIIGGDFEAKPAAIVTTMLRNRFKRIGGLKRKNGRRESLASDQIDSCEIVTEQNSKSILAKTGWGAAGMVTFGVVGLLAGALGGGNRSQTTALVTLTDGTSFMARGKSAHMGHLVEAARA